MGPNGRLVRPGKKMGPYPHTPSSAVECGGVGSVLARPDEAHRASVPGLGLVEGGLGQPGPTRTISWPS